MHRLIFFALLTIAVTGCSSARPLAPASGGHTFDYGPIASRTVDLHGVQRTRALGPFLEHAIDGEDRELIAVRPLYSHFRNPALEQSRAEYLWPVGYAKRFRDEHSGRFLLAFWTRFDVNDPVSRYRFSIFPFYFQGRDQHGESYLALFPLGGRIHEFLGMDRIRFFLFPLFLETELNTIESRSIMWPIYSHTEGEGVYRFRVFPFYGQNRFRDHYNKKFVMWPFWTTATYSYPGSTGSGYIFFPFYGRLKLDDQQSWLVMPPFFRVSLGDRTRWYLLPWPFFQRRTGEIQQTYLWPLWGQKRMQGNESRFFLWPILHQMFADHGETRVSRLFVLPFYYSEVRRDRETNPPPVRAEDPVPRGAVRDNYQKLWPFLSYIREGDETRLRILDLWPLKFTPSIERNYAPFWTLFQQVRLRDASETEALWGFFRRQQHGDERGYTSIFPLMEWSHDRSEGKDERRWAFFKGLIGYERQDTTRRYQLLYFIRFGGHQENGT